MRPRYRPQAPVIWRYPLTVGFPPRLTRPGLTLAAAVLAIGPWSMVHGLVLIALSFETKAMPTPADRLAGDIGNGTTSRGFGPAAS